MKFATLATSIFSKGISEMKMSPISFVQINPSRISFILRIILICTMRWRCFLDYVVYHRFFIYRNLRRLSYLFLRFGEYFFFWNRMTDITHIRRSILYCFAICCANGEAEGHACQLLSGIWPQSATACLLCVFNALSLQVREYRQWWLRPTHARWGEPVQVCEMRQAKKTTTTTKFPHQDFETRNLRWTRQRTPITFRVLQVLRHQRKTFKWYWKSSSRTSHDQKRKTSRYAKRFVVSTTPFLCSWVNAPWIFQTELTVLIRCPAPSRLEFPTAEPTENSKFAAS